MKFSDDTVFCDGCGVEVCWSPVIMHDPIIFKIYHYCCDECLDGLTCKCGERFEIEDDRRSESSQPITAFGV